jgi:rare lipoprotein A
MRLSKFSSAIIVTLIGLNPVTTKANTLKASYYGGGRSEHLSQFTASGARFRPWGFTCASWKFPLGTRLLVIYGRHKVVVTVNDRGPAAWTGRQLDVSRGAAAKLGLIRVGVGRVQVARLR